MSDIFISYKREEEAVARKLADALEREGWSVWWDPNLRTGEHFDDVIERALREAKCIVVVWSKLSVGSRYVRTEATYALDQDKLVPVSIDNVDLPLRFRGVQTLSLRGWDGSRESVEFRRLVTDLSASLGQSPAAITSAEERRRLKAEERRKVEEEHVREEQRRQSEAAKLKAQAESEMRLKKEQNRANWEAEQRRLEEQAQSKAEEERLRQAERQRSAEATRRPIDEANLRRIEEERKLSEQSEYRRREPKEHLPAGTERGSLQERQAKEAQQGQIDAERENSHLMQEDRSRLGQWKAVSKRPEIYLSGIGICVVIIIIIVFVSNRHSSSGSVFRDRLKDGDEGPVMVIIPAGTFKMGSHARDEPRANPVHEVRIQKAFALSPYEVTFEDYEHFAKAMGQPYPDDNGWGRGRQPVINITWRDATAYAKWLSEQTGERYRLPTEAEWEYAASSGGKYGDWAGTHDYAELRDYAWFRDNSNARTQPVGSRKPNGLGLYDMSGNVWEWVQDCLHNTYKSAPEDGSAWLETGGGKCDERIIRGGSSGDPYFHLRVGHRGIAGVDDRHPHVGFRIARDL